MHKKTISNWLTLIFLFIFAFYFWKNKEIFKPLLLVPVASLIGVALTKIAFNFSNGLFLKWSIEVFTKKIQFLEGVYVAILSAIGNYFGPLLGGATIRAVYLKKVHNLSYSYFASTLAGYYLILFAANCVLAIISLLNIERTPFVSSLLIFFTVWLAIMILLMLIRLPNINKFKRFEKNKASKFIIKALYETETGWRLIQKKRHLVLKLLMLAMLGFAITFVTGLIEFNAVSAEISLAGLGLYTAISTTSMLISLTPGAIGIRESLLLLTSSAVGVSREQILQVAVIDRGVTFIVLAVLYFLTYYLKPKISKDLDLANSKVT